MGKSIVFGMKHNIFNESRLYKNIVESTIINFFILNKITNKLLFILKV